MSKSVIVEVPTTLDPLALLPKGDLTVDKNSVVTVDREEESKTPIEPTTPPAKTVLFVCNKNHQWEVTVSMLDPKNPFTERDWNQLERLLISHRSLMRRKGALAYHEAMRRTAKPQSEVADLSEKPTRLTK